MTEARPVGATLLALLAALTALLGAFATLSLALTGWHELVAADLVARAVAMALIGGGFAGLAVGFWRLRAWVRRWCLGLFVLLGLAALLSADDSHLLELGAVLVLSLGFLVNAASLVYLRFPGVREQLQR